MRRSMLVVCALLAGTTLGCDTIKQAIEKRKNRNRPQPTQTATRDTTKTPAAPAQGTPAAPADTALTPPETRNPPPRAPVRDRPVRPVRDEPYNSPDTGTIAPGMGERDVITLWGPPAARRNAADFTYLHYPNGCEYSCGTNDIVILQNGQVVDAILRWSGHGYSGESSSPPGSVPEPTIP